MSRIYPYAGFWRRAIAFLADTLLAAVPPAVICLPLMFWQGLAMSRAEGTDAAGVHLAALVIIYLLWQVLAIISFWLYFAWQESGPRQATFGKRMMKIKVAGPDGGRIGFGRASGRTFAKWISYFTLYVGFMMAGTTRQKRALHDYIAQTYVVRTDFEPGGELPSLPSRPWLLAGLTVLLLGLFAVGLFAGWASEQTSGMAGKAAAELQALAGDKDFPQEPVEADGIVYFRLNDGLYAEFTGAENEGDYTLFLSDGADGKVCCLAAQDEGDCTRTGFSPCE